jgi:hypothetical protein
MNYALRILETDDIAAFHKMQNPPMSRHDAEICFHMARTQAQSVTEKKRYYSHHWLVERGLDSLLPDEMKPSALRVYPAIVKAVGISVNAKFDPELGKYAERRMSDKVAEMYADGDDDDARVSKEITAIRELIIGV